MKCNNCGVEINDDEVFCRDCKNKIKLSSSRSEAYELEELVKEQQKLNDLEFTKKIDVLENLEFIENEDLLEKTKKIDLEGLYSEEDIKSDDENSNNSNNKTKKTITIVVIIIVSLIIIMGIIILLINKDKDEPIPEIDYNKVITEYGDKVKKLVNDYKQVNNKVPSFNDIEKLINYDKYKVNCKVNEIYEDLNIYLSECEVDGKAIKYTYGKKQEPKKETTKITVYKDDKKYNTEKGDKVGEITCKGNNCKAISIYKTYIIIQDEDKNYIYNYENNSSIFGPFDIDKELSLDNNLYAVTYMENNIQNIYSLVSKKELKDIKGTIYLGTDNKINIIYKYGYAIFKDENKFNFINLKTGNTSYYIEGKSLDVLKETDNLLYMISYDLKGNIKIYNNNGKMLFEEEYIKNSIIKDYYVFSSQTSYSIYDLNLNLKSKSEKYDSILGIYEDLIVVLDKKHLKLLDFNNKLIVEFTDEFKNDYEYKEDSIKITDEKISLKVINKEEKSGTLGYVREYYYDLTKEESGVTEKSEL